MIIDNTKNRDQDSFPSKNLLSVLQNCRKPPPIQPEPPKIPLSVGNKLHGPSMEDPPETVSTNRPRNFQPLRLAQNCSLQTTRPFFLALSLSVHYTQLPRSRTALNSKPEKKPINERMPRSNKTMVPKKGYLSTANVGEERGQEANLSNEANSPKRSVRIDTRTPTAINPPKNPIDSPTNQPTRNEPEKRTLRIAPKKISGTENRPREKKLGFALRAERGRRAKATEERTYREPKEKGIEEEAPPTPNPNERIGKRGQSPSPSPRKRRRPPPPHAAAAGRRRHPETGAAAISRFLPQRRSGASFSAQKNRPQSPMAEPRETPTRFKPRRDRERKGEGERRLLCGECFGGSLEREGRGGGF